MKLYKRKGSPYYYLRQGDQLISLKTTRKGQALQLLEEYQAKRLGVYRAVHRRASEYLEPYLAHCRKYNKDTTIEDKERTLNFFKAQAGDPWLRQINKKIVVEYLDSRKGNRSKVAISAERFNTERQVLNNFFNYLMSEKVLKENPAKEIEKKRIVRNKEPKSLARDIEKKLDKWLSENDEELLRVKSVAVNTGLRARELVNLTWPGHQRRYSQSHRKTGLDSEGLRRANDPVEWRGAGSTSRTENTKGCAWALCLLPARWPEVWPRLGPGDGSSIQAGRLGIRRASCSSSYICNPLSRGRGQRGGPSTTARS